MAQEYTLKGSECKVYINGNSYPAENINFSINYSEEGIYGIDSVHPQEIAGGKISVTGSITGIALKMDGGLQGYGARPLLKDAISSPYIQIRVQERVNKIDLLNLNDAKVTNESYSISKGVVRCNFSFTGIYPSQTMDMA